MKIPVLWELMERNVVLSAGAKTEELAIPKTVCVLANLVGQVLFVRTGVHLVHGVKTVVKRANVTTVHHVIISPENVNVYLVSWEKE